MSQTRTKSATSKNSGGRLVSYREMRQLQRQAEQSHVGPGSTEYLRPFGSNLGNVGFGRKYEFKASKNPGPGSYETSSGYAMTRSRSQTTFMKGSQKGVQSYATATSGPGTYDPHKKFGENDKRMTIGSPYKHKPNQNPPPGLYDLEMAWNRLNPNVMSPNYNTKETYRRKREITPDAGFYEPSKPFGYSPKKMTIGGKYKWKPDQNPHPAYYEPKDTLTKSRSPVTKIKGSPNTRSKFLESPANGNPSALSYNGIKPFGSENKNKMTLGGKYSWKPNNVPPPGHYEADHNKVKPRVPSAFMKQEQLVYYYQPVYQNQPY